MMNNLTKGRKPGILGAGALLALALLLLYGTAEVAYAQQDRPPRAGISSQDDVTEGESAVFTVTIARAPSSNLLIPVTVYEYPPQGSVAAIGQTGARVVTIPSGYKTGTLNVATDDDSTAEPRGMITAVIDTPTLTSGYTLDRTATYSSVVVSDNDNPTPQVTVSPWIPNASEAHEKVTFTVSANPAPQDPISVNVNVTATGDYGIQPGAHVVVVPTQNNGSIEFSVPFIDDVFNEANGTVTATVQAGNDYDVGSPASSTINIIDNDTTYVSISGGSAVTEGEAATYTLSASPWPYQAISVKVNVAPSSEVTGVTAGVQTVSVPTTGSASFTVSTTDNSHYAPFGLGSITATVKDNTGYDVGSPPSARVDVLDDDGPVITIAPVGDVTEGADASFTLTSNPPVSNGVTVNLEIATTGDYGVTAGSKTVYIPDSGSKTYSLSTTDDAFDEPDGTVKATVNTGLSYVVGAPSSATVNVADDEATLSGGPVLTLAAGADVTEGEHASFTITATPAVPSGQTLDVNIGFKVPGLINLPRTETMTGATHTYTVITDDNNFDEHDVTASSFIKPGTGYTLGDPYTASLTVVDNDLAKVYFSGPGRNWIDEDGSAKFGLTVNPSSDHALTIEVEVTSTGDFGIPAHTKRLSIPARTGGTGFAIFSVPDQVHEPNGSFTVTVQPNSAIEIVGSASQTITVRDDDPSPGPRISIEYPIDKAKAGGKLEFVINLSETWADTVSVDYRIDTMSWNLIPGTDFYDDDDGLEGTIEFAPGERQAVLDVHIDPWAPVEHRNKIAVELTNPVNGSFLRGQDFAIGYLTNK